MVARCICAAFALLPLATAILTCKTDSGHNVDFNYAFKYPGGWEYAYMDSDTDLEKSDLDLTASTSCISRIVSQMFDDGVSTVMWNDQPPPDKDSKSPIGHMKGVLMFSSSGGVWLTHSLPHFPSPDGRSGPSFWKEAADTNGQSFLCITLDAEEVHKLSPVMKIDQPDVYHTRWASGAEEKFSDVKAWAEDKEKDEDTMTAHVEIRSKGGQTFNLFGKSGLWGHKKDLYRDLVAKAGSVDLEMEGWRCGAGVWDAACTTPKVLDILSVSFPGMDFETTRDHSKWAVGTSGTIFCVGDINRADGQDERGGGTVCIHDSSIAGQMRKRVVTKDSCHRSNSSIIV